MQVAVQDAMVKHQIDKVVSIADQDSTLASFEAKPLSEFEKEFLQLIQQLVFEMRFTHDFRRPEAEEFEDVRITDGESRGCLVDSGCRVLQ